MDELSTNSPYQEMLAILKSKFENYYKEGMSLRSVARIIDMDPGTLSRILTGKRRISTQQVIQVIDRLNLDFEERKDLVELLVKDSLRSTLSSFNSYFEKSETLNLPRDIIVNAMNELSQEMTESSSKS